MQLGTKEQRLALREKVARLRLQGWSQSRIAVEVGLTQARISQILSKLTEEWQQSAATAIGEIKARQLAELDLVKSEAWEQWHRSKEDAVKKVAESTSGKKESGSKKSMTTEGQCGDPQYLKVVISAVAEAGKLLGTHAPVKHANTDPSGEQERTVAVWALPPDLSLEEWQKAAAAAVTRP